jgi:hypothetical protein
LDGSIGQPLAAPGVLGAPEQIAVRRWVNSTPDRVILDVFDPTVGYPVSLTAGEAPTPISWFAVPGVGMYASVRPDGLILIPDVRYLLQTDPRLLDAGTITGARSVAAGGRVLLGHPSPAVSTWTTAGEWLASLPFLGGLPRVGSLEPLLPYLGSDFDQVPVDVVAYGDTELVLTTTGEVAAVDRHELRSLRPMLGATWPVALAAGPSGAAAFDLVRQEMYVFDGAPRARGRGPGWERAGPDADRVGVRACAGWRAGGAVSGGRTGRPPDGSGHGRRRAAVRARGSRPGRLRRAESKNHPI